MENIFIVEIGVDYEGDYAVRAFTNHEDAVAFANELEPRLELPWSHPDYLTGDSVYVSTLALDDSSRYEDNY